MHYQVLPSDPTAAIKTSWFFNTWWWWVDCIEVLDPDLHHGQRDTDLCFPKRSSREDRVRALRHASNEGKFRKGGWTQNTQVQLATCRWFSTPWRIPALKFLCLSTGFPLLSTENMDHPSPAFFSSRVQAGGSPHSSTSFRNPSPRARQWFNAQILQGKKKKNKFCATPSPKIQNTKNCQHWQPHLH